MAMAKRYECFALTEYKDKQSGESRTSWSRCGVGFVNDDGSINVNLDCVPLSGRMQLREPQDRDVERARTPDNESRRRDGERTGGGR